MAKRTRVKFVGIIGVLLLVILSGCGETPDMLKRVMGRDIAAQRVSAGEGKCPTITTFTVSPLTAQCGDPVSLELAAEAPYAGELSYTWEIEGQSFETGQRAVWKTPTSRTIENPDNVYTVRGIVSDGECSITQSVEVKVLCNTAFDLMVHFPFAKAHLDATSRAQLDEIGEKLLQHPEHSILIEGHTDYIGNNQSNQTLGKRRAEAVKNYLINAWKIDSNRLFTRTFGEMEPIAPNETQTGRAKNRRAEVFRIILNTK